MEKFIKTTVGNNYNISLTNILFRKKTIKKSGAGASSQSDLEDREFFCSELIAKAFKEVGLLTTDQGSYKFMPSDFSKEGGDKLKLTSDACLGEELMIVFDEEELRVKKAELLK